MEKIPSEYYEKFIQVDIHFSDTFVNYLKIPMAIYLSFTLIKIAFYSSLEPMEF